MKLAFISVFTETANYELFKELYPMLEHACSTVPRSYIFYDIVPLKIESKATPTSLNPPEEVDSKETIDPFVFFPEKDYSNVKIIRDKDIHNIPIWKNKFHIRNSYCELNKEEVLAYAKNKIVEELNKEEYDTYDYVIMFDMNEYVTTGLINSIYFMKKYCDALTHDVLLGCGKNKKVLYGDIKSVRTKEHLFGPEVLGQLYFVRNTEGALADMLKKINKPIDVIAGYLGLAIIKKQLLKKPLFQALPNEIMDHVYRQHCDELVIPANYIFNNGTIGMYLYEGNEVFYYNTQESNYPVCNHMIPFCFNTYVHNEAKIAFHPKLVWEFTS